VEQLLDEPAVVLIALTLATLLFLAEVALPTLGIAGTLALVVGGVGVWAVADQDADWRPLLLSKLGVVLWVVLVAMRRRAPPLVQAPPARYGSGVVLFGFVEESAATVVTGLVLTALMGLGYPRIQDAAIRLLDQPPKVGMDWLVGQSARVESWDGSLGTVRVQGALWNAVADAPVTPGSTVTVIGFEGMTIRVAATQNVGGN
jgi:membrane-bound ClpP family serine protease